MSHDSMRNLFDQYKEPENRLTHALASCLHEDPALLRRFVRAFSGTSSPVPKRLLILEQSVPGEPTGDSEEDEKQGLPDAWIHDDEDWSLLIECKVRAPLTANQLHRHRRTAERVGFRTPLLLAITAVEQKRRRIKGVQYATWPEIYVWARKQARRSEWASRLSHYMQVAESKMITQGYLTKGGITVFDGIPFDKESPYSYREAKRVLRLLTDELRKRADLRKLGIAHDQPGRPAITGSKREDIWDFIPLKVAPKNAPFTKFPHLTVSLHRAHYGVHVTLPNGAKASCRSNLIDLEQVGFAELVAHIAGRLQKATSGIPGAQPELYAQQRHYPSQRSTPILDALLVFDLRTALPGGQAGVKHQPNWLGTVFDVMAKRQSNIQFGLGVRIPYGGKVVRSPKILKATVDVWTACKPWIATMLK